MNYTPIIVLGVVILIFYALMILPQQRRVKAHRELIGGLKKGDKVVSIGGLYGTVSSISGDKIVLEVAKGVEVTLARQAISTKLEEEKEAKET